ncbi:Yip1 family protein [Sulfitobacter sabulilitoris]|uniref:YIP1 family protein n=1 Tax=Sulfitobacter sabulilitoris TaxID=2562655 RepID=A0A5S3PJL3_9RHOB|nr:Yip1 family protein [Sulfitobacter sabulilitoris]TMM54598.1 YIP1 family protein [Sulfitobacter sabulilitoris]
MTTLAKHGWGQLALLTLRDPKAAAADIMAWDLPRDALWTALALVAAINTLIFGLSDLLVPVPTPSAVPAIFSSPLVFYVIVAGGLVVTAHALFWTGRALGGQGEFGDLLALLIWLQALRAAAQAAVLLAMLVMPGLAVILVFAASIAAMWILVNFISAGLHLNSIPRAITVLVAAILALVLGLSLILSMIGATTLGLPANV